jgi:hypothetical protein
VSVTGKIRLATGLASLDNAESGGHFRLTYGNGHRVWPVHCSTIVGPRFRAMPVLTSKPASESLDELP